GPERVDFEDAIPVATTRTAATENARAMPRRRRPLRPLPDVMPTTKAPPFLAKGAERRWPGGPADRRVYADDTATSHVARSRSFGDGSGRRRTGVEQLEHAVGGQREHGRPPAAERVRDRVDDGRGGGDRPALADAPERDLVERLGLEVLDLDRRDLHRG